MTPPPSPAAASSPSLPSMIVGGLGLVAIGALAAVLLLGQRSPSPVATTAEPAVAAASTAVIAPSARADDAVSAAAVAPPLPAAPAPSATPAAVAPPVARPQPAPAPARQPVAQSPAAQSPVAQSPAPVLAEAAPPAAEAPKAPEPGAGYGSASPAPAAAPHKTVCATCGVVVAVTPVHQQGEAGALGTVAGGVVGGVLGHQVGGGSGKTAMTVLGAVGGALAGREVEKHQRSTTVYDIRVRMDNGSTRSFTRNEAYVVGQKVHVDGDQLTLRAGSAQGGH